VYRLSKKAIIITNNALSYESFKEKYKVIFIEGTLMDVFITTRDYIHMGYTLLTHPLSGSVKPNETPYKTIAISHEKLNELDFNSLMLIENSMETAAKLLVNKQKKQWPESVLDDFRLIDFDLIKNALA
jgi:hypothetical protein